MLLDHVNLNHFRVFESVFRTLSMTEASQELHLTQSGVSQHVKSLEDMLGVKLFDRIKQRLVPTAEGALLAKHCASGLQEIEQALLKLKGGGKELAGEVVIGVPIEFGNNIIIPLLSKFRRKHPLVTFKLRMGYASAMNDELLKGTMDFAFIDEFRMDRRIATERVFDEVLELCISEDLLKKAGPPKLQRKYFEGLQYVEYQDDEPILRMWFAHHLETKHIHLDVAARVMDVQGVARFILAGTGAGILPGYVLNKLLKDGHRLQRFKGCGKPLKNSISVAYLQERSHPPAAGALLEWLKSALVSKEDAQA